MLDAKAKFAEWLSSPLLNPQEKEELVAIQYNEEEILDRFYKDLEFGTGGLRGVMGIGTNRMNRFVIRRATQGLANYLLKTYESPSVAIAYDSRNHSDEYAKETASTLAKNGIKVYLYPELMPTPALSFAVRYFKCQAGVVVTASHNPKIYNGYKVYDETGCQLVPEKIERLLQILAELPNELDVSYESAEERGENIILDNTVDDEYVRLVESIAINCDLKKDDFKIVFTPNHGTSYVNAMRIFKDLGYVIYPVLSQCDPDPDFSGTLSPNPEDQRSYIEPIKLAKEVGADLIVMTDPDGDRVGLAYLATDGTYQTLTGNQSAALLMDYIFAQKKEMGTLSKDGVMYNTIVTSSVGEQIATAYGVKTEQFLTGFKYIGNRIDYYEKKGHGPKFEFGYEESYGCLIAPFARDKDGCQAILMYCEMALYYFLKGYRLDVAWDDLCKRFGYHQDITYSMEFFGSEGQKQMEKLMKTLHNKPFLTIDGLKVIAVDDIQKSEHISIDKSVKPILLPKADVVKLYLEDGSTVTVRPSGTEPKVKFYVGTILKEKPKDNSFPDKLFKSLKETLGI